MENGRMHDYSNADLMAAILDLRDATALNSTNLESRLEKKIDALRSDMNRRFDGVDDRFDGIRDDMNGRFAQVEARFDKMDIRFDKMDVRFDKMDVRFDRLEDRVAAIEPRGHSPAS
jgi:hypothetical protein